MRITHNRSHNPGQDRQWILYFQTYGLIWLRYIMITASIFGAATLGILAGKKNPLYAVIAACLPIIVAGLEILLRNQNQWPLLILISAAFIPFSLPTGTESRIVFSLIVTSGLTAIWIIQMLLAKRLWIYPSPINLPLLGFCLVVIISLIWSNVFRDPLVYTTGSFPIVQAASGIVMIMLPSALFITANFAKSIKDLKVMVAVMLLAGTGGLVGRFLDFSLPINTEGLSAMWFIALSISLVYFDQQLSRNIRLLLMSITVGWVVWGFGMHVSWLAGWLPGILALGLITWRRSKPLAIVIGIVVLIFLLVNSNYYLGTVLGNEQSESGHTRLAAWEMNWLVTGKHLLFGTGPAGYAAYYMSYFPTQAMATHNNLLDIISQTGIFGFVLSTAFFVILLWKGYKLCLRLQGRRDFAEALANGAFAGTVGSLFMMGLGDWIFPFAYTQTIAGFSYAVYCWLFMGTIIALERITKPDTHQSYG